MKLTVLAEELAICRLAADESLPGWIARSARFVSVTRTSDELSIVCPVNVVPAEVKHNPGWRALKVEGPLDFGLTGIIAELSACLAGERISVFTIATYDTDYLLVQSSRLSDAVSALESGGHDVRTDPGN